MNPSVRKHTIIFTVLACTMAALVSLLIFRPFSAAPAAPVQKRQINIYLAAGKMRFYDAIKIYAKKNWKFPYELKCHETGAEYDAQEIMSAIDVSLKNGDSNVDIYLVPGIYASKYIKEYFSGFACTYKELGIDIDTAAKNADIPSCVLDAGRNADGEIIALPYLAETSVFIYRRSIAKEVWGTDDPETISHIIGGGTRKWDKFLEAAQDLKKHGYYIVPGFSDLSYMLDTKFIPPVQENVKLINISPALEEYMDVSKLLFDNGFIGDTRTWTGQWFSDMKGDKVFATVLPIDTFEHYLDLGETYGDWAVCLPPFSVRDAFPGIFVSKHSPNKDLLGPLVEWMTLDCTKNGLQYGLANGTLFSEKMAVVSGTVLKNTESCREVFGGQNINPIIYEALNQPMGKLNGNDAISYWIDAIDSYVKGEKSKKEVIRDYNKEVAHVTF